MDERERWMRGRGGREGEVGGGVDERERWVDERERWMRGRGG